MGRPKANSIHANGLTDRQEMILEFIRSYISENNYPPSVREIGKGVGLASSASVHNNMKKLASLGFLNWDTDKPRTYGLADEHIEDMYPIPTELLGTKDDVFMMVVEGDSMKDAGILDRDYVFVRRQDYAQNGDIVVALLNGEETTIKRYFRELKQIRLVPENSAYSPIVGTDNIKITGVVVGVFRVL